MWMYTLLPQILNMSLTASIVIILVLAARLLLKKAPKIFSYALWAVVLFRLLCPVSFSSRFSLIGRIQPQAITAKGGAFSSVSYIPADIVHAESPRVDLPVPGISEVLNDSLPHGPEQLAADPLEFPAAAATVLWLIGIGAMLLYSAVSLIRLRGRLTGAVRLRDNIYLADHIATPFVIGVWRPKIYLPSTLTKEEQGYVILHEQTHIRRLDHLVKMLAFLALAVHWFNPLVWLAFVIAVKDMEMSCDERVLKLMGDDIRSAYGASLLSQATGRRLINGSPLAFGEGNIKERIKNVMNFKKPAAWVVAVSVLLVAALSIGFALNGPDNAYKSLFRKRFAEARRVGLHYTADNCRKREAAPDFVAGDTEYYLCGHYKSKEELRAATDAVFTKNLAQDFYSMLDSEAFLEQDGRLYTAPEYLSDVSLWQCQDTITFDGKTVKTFLWDTLTMTSQEDSKAFYTLDWYHTYPGLPVTSSFTLIKGEDGVWRFDECFGDTGNIPETAFIKLQTFNSEETDLIKLGKLAFSVYMDYLSSEGVPIEKRIASCKLNEISVLAGDIYEFCVALNYDITTDSDSYLNPPLGAQGKGTWPDNYMEIRVVKHADDNMYSIKSIGTGGGAQGLVPYNAYILTAFVDETLSEEAARALQSRIEQNPNVKYADFETREEALTKFMDKYEDKSLFENTDAAVFRHRYYIHLRDLSLAEQTSKDILQIEGIARVVAAKLSEEPALIDYAVGPSEKFSESEISSAMECVMLKFRDFKGCTLTKLYYDEEKSNKQIDSYTNYGRGFSNGVGKDNVIVLYSEFTVDSSGGDGSFNPNSTYKDWMWILIRDGKDGTWRVDDWGY